MPRYYDRQGKPMSQEYWVDMIEDEDYRRVASTKIGSFWISTVWLGLDHNWDPDGPPAIFETMIFDQSDRPFHDLECRRYSTEEQALLGHDNMVAYVGSLEKYADVEE